jgi:hypothetical protein
VEYTIQNLDETASAVERQIAETRKRLADLSVQAGQPFEYEARLTCTVQKFICSDDKWQNTF